MLHLLKGSREELAKYIKEQNKKIVLCGYGCTKTAERY